MSQMILGDRGAGRAPAVRIALVTAREAMDLDPDLRPLVEALQLAGAQAEAPRWDDPAVDWSGYDAALLRSTWDYADRIDEFLAWCARCGTQTRLLNPLPVVRWNTDKHYLRDLSLAGIPVVPTRFVEPGSPAPSELGRFLDGTRHSFTVGQPCDFDDFVVKPAIGAGSRDAARYPRAEIAAAGQHLERLLAAGRSAMLQPYLGRVDEHGETAVLYLGGVFSHAIRKGPLLRTGAGPVEGLFAPEEIRPRTADEAELAVALAAYRAIPFGAPAYARVDLLRDAAGSPAVLELELTEPSLFFAQAPGSADRFADWLVRTLRPATDA